jgi:cell division protein FtsB
MRPPRVLALLVASVALVAVLFLFVLPGRAYLAQRRTLAAAETRVNVLGQANSQLNRQIALLQTDAEIERRAREYYGLIKPNETPYAILPSPAPAAPAASSTPAKTSNRGLPSRIWRDLQFWN